MAVIPTNFHEVDPDDEFELIPPGDMGIAADCCTCAVGGPSPCDPESSGGAFATLAAGQVVAFWYV